jgi:hypothetical protein
VSSWEKPRPSPGVFTVVRFRAVRTAGPDVKRCSDLGEYKLSRLVVAQIKEHLQGEEYRCPFCSGIITAGPEFHKGCCSAGRDA